MTDISRDRVRRQLIQLIPYILIGLLATKLGQAWRLAEGADASAKLLHIQGGLATGFQSPWPRFEAADLLLSLEGRINPGCTSDLGVGAAALSAAARSSWINILINLKALSGRDDPFVISAYAEGKRLLEYVTSRCDTLYEHVLALYEL